MSKKVVERLNFTPPTEWGDDLERSRPEFYVGLFADYKGYAISLVQIYRVVWGKNKGLARYIITENYHSKKVSFSGINANLEEIKNKYESEVFNCFTNNLYCKELLDRIFWDGKLIVEHDNHSTILLLMSLLNDKLIIATNEIKENIVDNIKVYDPNEDEINHMMNALFFALNGYVVEQKNYEYECFVSAIRCY